MRHRTLLERCWKEIKAIVTKPEGRCSANFVACLCHQHRVGTTDVPMMSYGKGIGQEGGTMGAREDRCGWGLALRDGEGGKEGGSLRDLQSRCSSVFRRYNLKCVRGVVLSRFIFSIYTTVSHSN